VVQGQNAELKPDSKKRFADYEQTVIWKKFFKTKNGGGEKKTTQGGNMKKMAVG